MKPHIRNGKVVLLGGRIALVGCPENCCGTGTWGCCGPLLYNGTPPWVLIPPPITGDTPAWFVKTPVDTCTVFSQRGERVLSGNSLGLPQCPNPVVDNVPAYFRSLPLNPPGFARGFYFLMPRASGFAGLFGQDLITVRIRHELVSEIEATSIYYRAPSGSFNPGSNIQLRKDATERKVTVTQEYEAFWAYRRNPNGSNSYTAATQSPVIVVRTSSRVTEFDSGRTTTQNSGGVFQFADVGMKFGDSTRPGGSSIPILPEFFFLPRLIGFNTFISLLARGINYNPQFLYDGTAMYPCAGGHTSQFENLVFPNLAQPSEETITLTSRKEGYMHCNLAAYAAAEMEGTWATSRQPDNSTFGETFYKTAKFKQTAAECRMVVVSPSHPFAQSPTDGSALEFDFSQTSGGGFIP